MLLLYGLAALCLSLAHAERIFAEPMLDRASFCLSDGHSGEAGGLPDCGLCSDQAAGAPLFSPILGGEARKLAAEPVLFILNSAHPALQVRPLGSRAPPRVS